MDGNSAKKAPVLDHLVDTSNAKPGGTSNSAGQKKASNLPLWASANNNEAMKKQNGNSPDTQSNKTPAPSPSVPQNRHTDKSQFELELTETVNRIMLKHFEHASEQIVQQVLNEVRARLPGKRKP